MDRKKILVAASPAGQYRAQQALSGTYSLTFASKLSEAKEALRVSETGLGSTFNMVIGDVYFDDSRMFELLQYIRSVDHYDTLPFLAVRPTHSDLGGVSSTTSPTDSTKVSVEMLGACAFLELQDLPDDRANELLLETVEGSFYKTVEHERIDRRGSERIDPDSMTLSER